MPEPIPAAAGRPPAAESNRGTDPSASPQRVCHHLLLCATPSKALCCPDPAVGAASWDTLKRLVRDWGLEDPKRPEGIVLRSKADCLRICAEGPVLLIWPEGCVYGGVTPERIERILREHVIEGRPIEAWIRRSYGLAVGPSPLAAAAARASSQAATQRSDQLPPP